MKKPPLGRFAFSIVPPLTVLLAQIVRVQVLPGFHWIDNVAHFFGGFTIAWMFIIITNTLREHSIIPHQTPKWLTDYTVWGTVGLVGIFWEFWELGMTLHYGFKMQFTITETLGDVFFDLSGGLVFLLIYRFIKIQSCKK